MKDEPDKELVAPCGIYCGTCLRYKQKKCKGCHLDSQTDSCKVKNCAVSQEYHTCAECTRYPDVKGCGKLNSFTDRLVSIISKSDKTASIKRIAEAGPVKYAREMSFKNEKVLKKNRH